MSSLVHRRRKRPRKSSSSIVAKRLQKELLDLMSSGYDGVSAFPEPDNFFAWRGSISGPLDSVYEGLTFRVRIAFPDNYPYVPPVVFFDTPCFHPNVAMEDGSICLDILKENWSAIYNVSSILISLQSLLASPNNESPLNPVAASLWDDVTGYKAMLHSHYHGAKLSGGSEDEMTSSCGGGGSIGDDYT